MIEKEFPKDALINLAESHKDERGSIQPLCDLDMKSASIINLFANYARA